MRKIGARCTVLLFFCLLFSGCATLIPAIPKETTTHSFTMPGAFDDVWKVALATVISEYIPIETEDEATGTIQTADFRIQKDEYRTWTKKSFTAQNGFGRFTLVVVPVSESKSRIDIEATFQSAKHGLVESRGSFHHSTGAFEQHFASRVHSYLVLKKYPGIVQLVTGCNFYWNESIERYEISGVKADSFGAEQGFENGDIVVQLDGVEMTMENFFEELTAIRTTETKSFFLDRGGEGILVDAEVIRLPDDLPLFGFQVDRNSVTGQFFVTKTEPGSPAKEAGLLVDDILLQEEDISLTSWRSYYHAMSGAHLGVDRQFLVQRNGGEPWWITVKTEPFKE